MKNSQLTKTNPALSRIWFSHNFNELDETVELNATFLLVDKRKLVVSMLTEFAINVILFLKRWDVIITTVFVKKLARL